MSFGKYSNMKYPCRQCDKVKVLPRGAPVGVRPMVLGPQDHRPTLDIGDESGSLAAGLGFSRLPCQRHHRLY